MKSGVRDKLKRLLLCFDPNVPKGIAELCVLAGCTFKEFQAECINDQELVENFEMYKTYLAAWAESRIINASRVGNVSAMKMMLESNHPEYEKKKKIPEKTDNDKMNKSLDDIQKIIEAG